MDPLVLAYIQLFGGLVLLVVAADWLVDGAVALASRIGVAPFVVGLTVIAYGTSLPEFVVSILASSKGVADFAIGNIVGSNIANIGLVLGVAAVIHVIRIESDALFRRDLPLLTVVSIASILFFLDGTVDRIEGGGLLLVAVIFTVLSLRTKDEGTENDEDGEVMSTRKMVVLLAIGLVGLVGGAQFMVEGGTFIARAYGISERIIGLTIVAIGTSLPELAASVAAATKGHPDLAVGNVVGSCLFNRAFVLGASALIHPLAVQFDGMFWDVTVMMALTVGMWGMLRTGAGMSRVEGMLLVASYAGFMVYVGYTTFSGG
ncbi:MAG: calcium/sodium antiporter [Myxococcota bacterium]|nr:calcium/sodium antiporter [Myxococcota bacterium]